MTYIQVKTYLISPILALIKEATIKEPSFLSFQINIIKRTENKFT